VTLDHVVGCTGKKRFVTFTKAASVARRIRRKDQKDPCEAYHCTSCAGFHVGAARDHGRPNPKKEALA
jgi:hypothetical protein